MRDGKIAGNCREFTIFDEYNDGKTCDNSYSILLVLGVAAIGFCLMPIFAIPLLPISFLLQAGGRCMKRLPCCPLFKRKRFWLFSLFCWRLLRYRLGRFSP